MIKKFKKISKALLVCLLVLSLIPVPVMAEAAEGNEQSVDGSAESGTTETEGNTEPGETTNPEGNTESESGTPHEHRKEDLVITPGKDSTCNKSGYEPYWYCGTCEKYFSQGGEALEEITEAEKANWEKEDCKGYIAPDPNKHVEDGMYKMSGKGNGKAPSCEENGYREHFKCKNCKNLYYTLEDGTKINIQGDAENWKNDSSENGGFLPPLGHNLVRQPGKASTCTEPGWKEYWQCSGCEKYFYGEEGNPQPIGDEQQLDTWKNDSSENGGLTLPLGHNLVRQPGKASTCATTGWKEYWKCSGCGNYFYGEEGNPQPIGGEQQLNNWKKDTSPNGGCRPKDPTKHTGSTSSTTTVTKSQCTDSKKVNGSIVTTRKCNGCNATLENKSTPIPAVASITLTSTTIIYDGTTKAMPAVVVKNTAGKQISSNDYEVICVQNNMKDVGKKTFQIKFKNTCSNYTGTATVTGNYEIIPKQTYTLTLGKSLKISDLIGAANAQFSLGTQYTKAKGNYGFTLTKDKKTIKTSLAKIKIGKAKQYFNVSYKINGKTYTTKVKLMLADPSVTCKKKGTGYIVKFGYNYPKNTGITIRIAGLSVANKDLDRHTKKYKKSNSKSYITCKKATAQKLGNKAKITFTLKCKGWETKKYTTTVNFN